jgi:hypothetical protein
MPFAIAAAFALIAGLLLLLFSGVRRRPNVASSA